MVAAKILHREAFQVSGRADDALPQGRVGPECVPGEGVRVDQPAALVDLVEGLFEDDRSLGLDLVERGRAEHGSPAGAIASGAYSGLTWCSKWVLSREV
jgi:hypothetical protein